MQRSVAVVGGGVGGLAAAAGFARDGWRVTVLERAPGPVTDGTALGMWPAAVRALDGLGLGDGLRARSTRESSMSLCRPDGRRLVTVDTDRRGSAARLIARPDLVALLAGALPDGVVRHDSPVGAADVAALRAEHDLVVGADGIRSTVRGVLLGTTPPDRLRATGTARSVLFGPTPPDRLRATGTIAARGVTTARGVLVGPTPPDRLRATGTVAARGITAARGVLFGPTPPDRLRATGTVAFRGVAAVRVDAGTETWGRGARFGVLPHGAGRDRANWYATLPVADVRGAGDDVALLRERFGDWHDPIGRVLDRIGEDGYLRHELEYVHPHLPRFTDGRSLAVLGDAAHAMTPDLGQGACQALLDGVALAAALRDRSVPDGLAAYDRARRRPTRRLVTLARLVHGVAQARHGTVLRDAVLRAAPV